MTEDWETFELVVKYDEQFTEQVERGEPNPLAELTLRAGDYDLTGAPENQFYLDDYIYFNLRKQLDAIKEVLNGERCELTFYSIPDDLILKPEDDIVYVSLLNSRGNQKNDAAPNEGVPVKKEIFVTGLINTAEEFHEKVTQINPELEDSEQMQSLREYIENAEHLLREVSKADSK